MLRFFIRGLFVVLACALAACDDNTISTPGVPAANVAPVINIASNTSFGVAGITTFLFAANAGDPNGNPITVTWTFSDGTTAAGLNVARTFPAPTTIDAVATATDHLGLSTTSNPLSLTIATGTGTWAGTIDLASCEAGTKAMSAVLTQNRAILTGTISFPNGLCAGPGGSGPLVDGRILTGGGVRGTVRIGTTDVTIDAQMTTTGNEINGTVSFGDLTAIPIALTRQ